MRHINCVKVVREGMCDVHVVDSGLIWSNDQLNDLDDTNFELATVSCMKVS